MMSSRWSISAFHRLSELLISLGRWTAITTSSFNSERAADLVEGRAVEEEPSKPRLLWIALVRETKST